MKPKFEIISDGVEMYDNDGKVVVFERHYFKEGKKVVEYITEDEFGGMRYFIATKDPENLTKEERHRVLEYSIGVFQEDEIVNYLDLFLQGEFLKEVEHPNF